MRDLQAAEISVVLHLKELKGSFFSALREAKQFSRRKNLLQVGNDLILTFLALLVLSLLTRRAQ